MGEAEPAIVAFVSLKIERRNDGKMFAAHIEELGITAYERTVKGAESAAFDLFNRWVNLYRAAGTAVLENRLEGLGVEYSPMGDYQGPHPIVDTRSHESIDHIDDAGHIDDTSSLSYLSYTGLREPSPLGLAG